MKIIPHSEKQQKIIYSEAPITAAITGIQWGKTKSGAVWLKRRMHKFNSSKDNFLVTSPTYKIMKQSSLPAFMEINKDIGVYNKVDGEFKINNGGTVYFRSATEPDSIVGLTNVRGIWGDECGKYSLYFWDNLEGRAAFANSPICLTTSPYSMNWLYKQILKPYKRGDRKDICLVQATSIENPYFPKEVYYKRKENMDLRRFNAMYGGQFEKMEGLVYDCFDEDLNSYTSAQFPNGTKFFGGIDWGYTDPFVLQVRAVTPEGNHYQVSEFYKTQMRSSDIIDLCKKKMQVYNIKQFYCDPSQPGMIDELNSNKIPASKANNDIRLGIDVHYELIKSRKFKIIKGGSRNSVNEYETYHYPEPVDLKPDQDAKIEKPVDQDNHAMDTARYISIMTSKIHKKNSIKVSNQTSERKQETTDQYVKRIKRKPRGFTESW